MYIDLETLVYPLSAEQVMHATPNTIFPTPFVAPERYALVSASDIPAHDPATHKAVELAPVEVDGAWSQQWDIVELTEQEIADMQPPTPDEIPRYCGVLALKRHVLDGSDLRELGESDDWAAGSLYASVQEFRASMPPGAARDKLDVALNDVSSWMLSSPVLASMCAALGLSNEQRDELFVWAKAHEAML